MPAIRSVTVYAASSRRAPPDQLDLAAELGRGLAGRGWTIVDGGARIGLMGALADAALGAGGRVEGVILDTFARVAHAGLHALETVADMRARKAGLAHRGDAYVVLPGGLGTLEELSEIAVERQLGLHARPLVLVNFEGFWDPLVAQLDRQVEVGLVRPAHRAVFAIVRDAAEAIAALEAAFAEGAPAVAPDLGKLA